jgi:hypothetical protein
MFEALRRQSVSEEADAERIAGRLSVRGGHGCGHAGELFGGFFAVHGEALLANSRPEEEPDALFEGWIGGW